MDGKRKMKRCDVGASAHGRATAQETLQESQPPTAQKLRCFRDVLEIVINMSDEEWRSLTKDAPNMLTRLEFAALCTNAVISLSKTALKQYLLTLFDALEIEAVLSSIAKLEKQSEAASSIMCDAATCSSDSSAKDLGQKSSLGLPVRICDIVDHFISDAKMAMEEAVHKTAACKIPSSKNWKMMYTSVAKETLNILSAKLASTQPLETTTTGIDIQILREARENSNPDAAMVTGKIVMVVLDLMDGSSATRPDLDQTRDLLMAAAQRIKHMESNGEQSLTSRMSVLGNEEQKRLREEFQSKASRAVSQVLLSNIGVGEMYGSSELTNSLAGRMDTMLGAMSQEGFPVDSIVDHLDSSSSQIVQIIAGWMRCHLHLMNALSSASKSHTAENKGYTVRDSGWFSDINHMFSMVNEKVKEFFNVAKHPGKGGSELLGKSNVRDQSYKQKTLPSEGLVPFVKPVKFKIEKQLILTPSQTEECDVLQDNVDFCTGEIPCKNMDFYKNEIQLAKSGSSEVSQVSQSASLHSDVQSDEFSSCTICPTIKESEMSTAIITSGAFPSKITQVMSDLLKKASPHISQDMSTQTDLSMRPCSPSSQSSPGDFQTVAVNIAGTVIDALDSLVESSVINSESDSATIVSALDSFSFVSSIYNLSGSDISDIQTPCILFIKVRNYLQALFMSCFENQSSLKCESQPTASHSDVQLTKDHISMTSLDQILGKNWSFSKQNISGCSSNQLNGIFSTKFQSRATQVVSDLLLTTGENLASSVSTPCFKAPSQVLSQSITYSTLEELSTTDHSSVAASASSTEVRSTASDIVKLFLKHLRRFSSSVKPESAHNLSGPSPQKTSLFFRAVNKKVSRFLLVLKDSFPIETKTSSQLKLMKTTEMKADGVLSIEATPTTVSPRIQVIIDHCTEEVIGKVVELYKSEILLPNSRSAEASQIHQSVSLHSAVPCDGSTSVSMMNNPMHFLAEAARVVHDVLITRVSPKGSGSELRLHDSIGTSSSTSVLHAASTDLLNAAANNIVGTVVDVLDKQNNLDLYRAELTDTSSTKDLTFIKSVDNQAMYTRRGILLKRLPSVQKKVRDLFTPHNKCGRSASSAFSGRDTSAPSVGAKDQGMDISGLSPKHFDASVSALRRVSSALVGETMAPFSISSQDGLIHCCSTNPVNYSCAADSIPVNQSNYDFRSIIPKKIPVFNIHGKKSNKVKPLNLVPDAHNPQCSSSGHHQESSHVESKAPVSPRKKHHQLLSRMCSAFSKALQSLKSHSHR